MENLLHEYLSKYITITDELEQAIMASTFIKSYPKGTLLLEEGDQCNECYFILKGCIRSYCMIEGDEKTTEFYTEEMVVSPSCYGKNTPSDLYLECIEETIATVGTPEMEAEGYEMNPQLLTLTQAMAEVIMAKYQDTIAEFKLTSPEQRYLNLLKNRPDLLQRAPQHQIASYLGIKPESLSRIRKRIMSKK